MNANLYRFIHCICIGITRTISIYLYARTNQCVVLFLNDLSCNKIYLLLKSDYLVLILE